MFTVTETAGAHLAQMLEEHGLPEEIAVRFVLEGEGLSLRQESEQAGDTTFEHEGRRVLLLDAQVSELLAEHTLDVEGVQLTLRLPQEDE